MKNLILVALVFAAPGLASAQTSKEDLKKLAKAGLSEEVLIAFVRSHGAVDKLTCDDLIQLKEAGLTDKVLASLLAPPEPPKARVVERESNYVAAAPRTVYVDAPYSASYYPSVSYSIGWCGSHYAYDRCGYSSSYYRSYPSYYRSYPSYYSSWSYRSCAPRTHFSYSSHRSHGSHSHSSGGRIVSRLSGRVGW